jgi:hypothetical protein
LEKSTDMTLSTIAGRQLDRVARRFGHRVFPEWALHPSQISEIESIDQIQVPGAITPEAAEYLNTANPRLLELRRMYAGLDDAVRTPLVWAEKFTSAQNLADFRGNSMWVYQLGDGNLHARAYLLATYYLMANDRLGLMQKLPEDGAFGAICFEMAGRVISRDLLDSILEIDFLDRHLQIASRDDLSILDIGAGYGRLAHRVMSAFPSLPKYWATDVIAESSFVCEYYLRFRGLQGRCELAPGNEIDRVLQLAKIGLAINIHSFSECPPSAIGWWIEKLAIHGVKYLMVVPNAGNHGGQLLRNNVGQDMLPLIERKGFRLIAREAKYADPEVQKFGLNPTCYWLFELKS